MRAKFSGEQFAEPTGVTNAGILGVIVGYFLGACTAPASGTGSVWNPLESDEPGFGGSSLDQVIFGGGVPISWTCLPT